MIVDLRLDTIFESEVDELTGSVCVIVFSGYVGVVTGVDRVCGRLEVVLRQIVSIVVFRAFANERVGAVGEPDVLGGRPCVVSG